MFERFTERARHVVVLAQEEARDLKHNYIGTEHILLGLLREEEGLAARVLQSLGITLERARHDVTLTVGSGEEVTAGQIPFTPRAKKVIELALREALSLAHDYIGTEHILLGLVRENEGVAARILLDFDADSEKIRNELMRIISGPGGPGRLGGHVAPRLRGVGSAVAGPGSAEPPAAGSGSGSGSGSGRGDALMARLEREIRASLDREPDNGDLLVILSALPEGVVARALADLGIREAELDGALERARAAAPDDIEEQIERVRQAKDAALDAGTLEEAKTLRERERELRARADADLLGHVRERLGLRAAD